MIKIKPAAIAILTAVLAVPAAASALCVKVPEANLRQGPGTQYEKSWEVFRYMPFKKIGQQGNWYRVRDVDGDTHWVYSNLLSSKMHCAVVKVDKANVRNGPGTNYPQAQFSPVEKYYSFKVTGTKGNWVKVQDDVFNEGWVFKSLLWVQ